MEKDNIRKEIISIIERINACSLQLKDGNNLSPSAINDLQKNASLLNDKCVLLGYLNTLQEEKQKPVPQTEKVLEKPREAVSIPDKRSEEIKPVEEVKKQEVRSEPTKPETAKHQHIDLNKPPLSDIKAGIGINEKIRFIKELFQGNAAEYNNTLELINGSASLQAAKNGIDPMLNKYKWDKDSEIVMEFYHLIERRFS